MWSDIINETTTVIRRQTKENIQPLDHSKSLIRYLRNKTFKRFNNSIIKELLIGHAIISYL